MSFVEIGKYNTWVRLSKNQSMITICKELRNMDFWKGRNKCRLFIDTKNNLFGLQPSPLHGYRISKGGRIRCRKLPEGTPFDGKFAACWNKEKELIIVDMSHSL